MPHIKQALCDAAMVSENWKYSLRDLPELLDTVCAYYKRRFDVDGITPVSYTHLITSISTVLG